MVTDLPWDVIEHDLIEIKEQLDEATKAMARGDYMYGGQVPVDAYGVCLKHRQFVKFIAEKKKCLPFC